MHTETIHVTEAAGNAVARHGPEEGVESGGLGAEEVPSGIVGGGGLGNLVVGARLDGVDKVGEADGILDEEDGDVVTDDIEVALIGIAELKLTPCSIGEGKGCYVVNIQSRGEAVNITGGVGGTPETGNGREADEDRCLLALGAQEGGGGDVGPVAITGEDTVGTGTTGMDDSLGNLVSKFTLAMIFHANCVMTGKTYALMIEVLELLAEDEVLKQC